MKINVILQNYSTEVPNRFTVFFKKYIFQKFGKKLEKAYGCINSNGNLYKAYGCIGGPIHPYAHTDVLESIRMYWTIRMY
jgi:hypothetical protein